MFDWLARKIYIGIIFVMRRTPFRRLRRDWIKLVPEHRREKAWRHFVQQERFGRKHARTILKVTLMAFAGIITIQLAGAWVFFNQAAGTFDLSSRPIQHSVR